MAILAATMANGGTFNGTRLLSESTIRSFHSDPIEGDMVFGVNYLVKGGVGVEKAPTDATPEQRLSVEGLEGCHGWIGYGGSVIQWHPELKISFAFVPTFLYWIDLASERGMNLLREVLRCAEKRTSA